MPSTEELFKCVSYLHAASQPASPCAVARAHGWSVLCHLVAEGIAEVKPHGQHFAVTLTKDGHDIAHDLDVDSARTAVVRRFAGEHGIPLVTLTRSPLAPCPGTPGHHAGHD